MQIDKRYIFTSITLGVIAASSALLISLTNLITKDQIAQNEINKVNQGIYEVFKLDNLTYEEEDITTLGLDEYKYVSNYYTVYDANKEEVGSAIRTSGSNEYGKISLIVGVDKKSETYINFYVVVDEQTFASTLKNNYIIPVQNHERDLDNVKCGATYGAKLIRNMTLQAVEAAKKVWNS